MMLLSRRSVVCVASAKKTESPIVRARKAFETKRMASLKENLNKIVAIATADVKELTDFVKELDDLHRKELMPGKSKPIADESVAEEDQNDENIFVKESGQQ